MRVIFTRNTKPQEGGPFRQGDVVDLAGPSLQRWIRRGAVEPVTEPTARHTRKRKPKPPEG